MKYDLIYKHSDFIIISKKEGVEFHTTDGIVQVLRKDFPEIIGVHRLDKLTSGLMVFARNEESAKYFNELFSSKKIQKYYMALATSKPKKKQGIVKGDIVKARGGSFRMSREMKNPSKTKFFSFSTNKIYQNLSLRGFLLMPFTGKTHQLRVVLKSLGSPILGDERYKGEKADRLYLHAFKLVFHFNNEEFKFVELPKNGECFKQLISEFKERLGEDLSHHFEVSY